MFTMLGFLCFLPCFSEDFERAGFHIQADGIGAMPGRWESVADEVVFTFEESVDHVINQLRVNDGTIRRDADNDICFRFFRGLIVTVKDIVETATCERDSAEVTVFGDGVVGGIGCRGEQGFGDRSRPRGPNEDALQHGLTCNVCEDLARQTR